MKGKEPKICLKSYWVVAKYYGKGKEMSAQNPLKGSFRAMEFMYSNGPVSK